MELAHILRRLWLLKAWVIGAALLSLIAGGLSVYKLTSLLPPKLESRTLSFGTGRMQLLVDAPRSPLIDVNADVDAVALRARLYSSFARSTTVTEAIAKEVGIPADELYIANGGRPTLVTQSRIAEQRANALLYEGSRYRLFISSEQDIPVLTLSGFAPDGEQAARLVSGAATAIIELVRKRADASQAPLQSRVILQPLGTPAGGTVNQGIGKMVAVIVTLVAFIVGCILILVGANVVSGLRTLAREKRALELPSEP